MCKTGAEIDHYTFIFFFERVSSYDESLRPSWRILGRRTEMGVFERVLVEEGNIYPRLWPGFIDGALEI
jgi:hypothetical protein